MLLMIVPIDQPEILDIWEHAGHGEQKALYLQAVMRKAGDLKADAIKYIEDRVFLLKNMRTEITQLYVKKVLL